MMNLESIQTLLRYNDWANGRIEQESIGLDDRRLDQEFDMGLGTLRKTFQHIGDAECVWLERWHGKIEVPWPAERPDEPIRIIADRLRSNTRKRDAFLATVQEVQLKAIVTYRDSKGDLFRAALSDMILQMCIHSTHHRAQAVNMLRRVGAAPPELDYMYWIREPV